MALILRRCDFCGYIPERNEPMQSVIRDGAERVACEVCVASVTLVPTERPPFDFATEHGYFCEWCGEELEEYQIDWSLEYDVRPFDAAYGYACHNEGCDKVGEYQEL